jgi:hypothetical protein
VAAQVVLILYYFVEEKGKPAWGGEANTSAEIRVNDLLATLGSDYDLGYEGLPLPDGRHISLMPTKTGEVAGFPLYDDTRLILAKGNRPVWVPVTRAQYLAALIHFREDELARAEQRGAQADPYREWASKREERRKTQQQVYQSLKTSDPAKAEEFVRTAQQRESEMEANLKSSASVFAGTSASLQPLRNSLAALRAELAAMPVGERASQAWWGGHLGDLDSSLVPAGTPNAKPLVAVNPDFFDRSRLRTDWQLITVTFSWEGLPPEHIGAKRLHEFRQSTDWKRVAALMD